jgi:hypothetical protein
LILLEMVIMEWFITQHGSSEGEMSRIVKGEFSDSISKSSPIALVETWTALSSVIIILI